MFFEYCCGLCSYTTNMRRICNMHMMHDNWLQSNWHTCSIKWLLKVHECSDFFTPNIMRLVHVFFGKWLICYVHSCMYVRRTMYIVYVVWCNTVYVCCVCTHCEIAHTHCNKPYHFHETKTQAMPVDDQATQIMVSPADAALLLQKIAQTHYVLRIFFLFAF